MKFNEFVGNEPVVKMLRSKLLESRFPHSLILAGPEGVGKRTFALMLAKVLNCETASPGDFCDACSQCRKIDAGTHADLTTINLEDDAAEIKIGQIRERLGTVEMRPLEGRNKILLIDPADAMNTSAANSLLKSLEEPPENTYFFLISSNPQSLLMTIRSRCQIYTFSPVDMKELQRLGGDELALRWCHGSIGLLKSLDIEAIREKRAAALTFLETVTRAKEDEFRTLISACTELSRSRGGFEESLATMTLLLEDLLFLSQNLPHRITNTDIQERLEELSGDLNPEQFIRVAEFLRTIEIHLNNYGNKELLSDLLAIKSNTSIAKICDDIPAKSR